MSHEPWLELAEIHALGTLRGEERARFEAHLAAGCADCEGVLRDTREALALFPGALAPVTPPPGAKLRVMQAIGGAAPKGSSACAQLAWAMAAVLGLLVYLLVQSNTQMAAVRGDLNSLQGELDKTKGTLKLLTSPHSQVIRLDGLPAAPGAFGTLVWDAQKRTGVFLGQNLPETSIGKVYELWALEDGVPVAAGTFSAGPGGRAILELPALPADLKIDTFAVTLEPAGGTTQPTGPMVLLGKTL